MSGRLPEHIDEIESFYKENLEGFEAFPSSDLWSKIDASLSQGGGGEPGTVQKSIWQSKWFLGGVGAVVLTVIIVAGFYAKRASSPIEEMDFKDKPLADSAEHKLPKTVDPEKSEIIDSPSNVKETNGEGRKGPSEIDKYKHGEEKRTNAAMSVRVDSLDSTSVESKGVETVEHSVKDEHPITEEEHNEEVALPKKNMFEKLKEKNKGKNDLFLKKDK